MEDKVRLSTESPEADNYYKILRKEYRSQIMKSKKETNITLILNAENKQKAIFELINIDNSNFKSASVKTDLF